MFIFANVLLFVVSIVLFFYSYFHRKVASWKLQEAMKLHTGVGMCDTIRLISDNSFHPVIAHMEELWLAVDGEIFEEDIIFHEHLLYIRWERLVEKSAPFYRGRDNHGSIVYSGIAVNGEPFTVKFNLYQIESLVSLLQKLTHLEDEKK